MKSEQGARGVFLKRRGETKTKSDKRGTEKRQLVLMSCLDYVQVFSNFSYLFLLIFGLRFRHQVFRQTSLPPCTPDKKKPVTPGLQDCF